MRSVEMKYFSFHMFDDETKTIKKIGKYIVTTKEMRVRNGNRIVLHNNKSIIYK